MIKPYYIFRKQVRNPNIRTFSWYFICNNNLYADTFDVDFKNKTHEVIKYAVEIGLMHIKRTMKTTIEMLTANPPEKGSYGNFDTAEWIKSNPGIFITEDADELINKAFENDNA